MIKRMINRLVGVKYEKRIEEYLTDKVRAKGGMSLKVHPGTSFGIPDRLIILPKGQMVFVELKREFEKPSELQLGVHTKLRALGCQVEVCDSMEEIDNLITKLTNETTRVPKPSSTMDKRSPKVRAISRNGFGKNNNMSNSNRPTKKENFGDSSKTCSRNDMGG